MIIKDPEFTEQNIMIKGPTQTQEEIKEKKLSFQQHEILMKCYTN